MPIIAANRGKETHEFTAPVFFATAKIDNPDALKGHEGHHIAVTGSVKGDSIHIDSMKML